MNERSNSHTTEAVDRDPHDRPGVPMVPDRPAPAAGTTALARQRTQVPVLVSVDVGQLTPVFSTAVPPRGLSGLMRRRAYRMHEHEAKRWLTLLLADRVDVWESRISRHPWVVAAFGAAALTAISATAAAIRGRRSPPSQRWMAYLGM
jgi:hypothetical protein